MAGGGPRLNKFGQAVVPKGKGLKRSRDGRDVTTEWDPHVSIFNKNFLSNLINKNLILIKWFFFQKIF